VARFNSRRKSALLHDEGIVRNRLKIGSTIDNARAFLTLIKERGSFDRYVWDFVGGRPLSNRPKSRLDVPNHSVESDNLSRDLKARGFRFVGTTICYALMQACGLVDDHVVGCFLARPL
jgi:DNA-3-methyladenine glycosylase I